VNKLPNQPRHAQGFGWLQGRHRSAPLAGALTFLALTLLLLVADLFFTSYSDLQSYIHGIVIGVVVAVLFALLLRLARYGWRQHRKGMFTVVGFILVLGLAYWYSEAFRGAGSSEIPVGVVNIFPVKYTAIITRATGSSDSFTVRETLLLHVGQSQITVPGTQTLHGGQAGFALRRGSFRPLGVTTAGYIPLPRRLPPIQLCTAGCPSANITLDLVDPAAFYRAVGTNVQTANGLTSWSASHLADGVTFYYVPAGYQPFRGLLKTFIGVTSIGQAGLNVLGSITGWLLSIIVAIVANLRDKITAGAEAWVQRVTGRLVQHGNSAGAEGGVVSAQNVAPHLVRPTASGVLQPSPGAVTTPRQGLLIILVWPIAAIVIALILRNGLVAVAREAWPRGKLK